MRESIVQWTLLSNPEFLATCMEIRLGAVCGQEVTTEAGRVDFIVEDTNANRVVVELETTLDSAAKRAACFDQLLRYQKADRFAGQQFMLLFAEETARDGKSEALEFSHAHEIVPRTYSLARVRTLYLDTVARFSASFGLALPQPKNYTICYLRWLNKILDPFRRFSGNGALSREELASHFSGSNSTNFRCYLRLAEDFEMLSRGSGGFTLSPAGREFIDSGNAAFIESTQLPSEPLTTRQKQTLIRLLTNGNWTTHKVNILWFLRFVEVTHGRWLPKGRRMSSDKLDLANGLFGVTYKGRTMAEFLSFACNWCVELGLVERIPSGGAFDEVALTPLGVDVAGLLGLDIHLRRSRMNLSLRYLG